MDAGIETVELGGNTVYRCCDCGRWVREQHESIRHSSRCDTPKAQPSTAAPAPSASKLARAHRAAKDGAIGAVLTDDEIVAAVRTGLISGSDAMNRDD